MKEANHAVRQIVFGIGAAKDVLAQRAKPASRKGIAADQKVNVVRSGRTRESSAP